MLHQAFDSHFTTYNTRVRISLDELYSAKYFGSRGNDFGSFRTAISALTSASRYEGEEHEKFNCICRNCHICYDGFCGTRPTAHGNDLFIKHQSERSVLHRRLE